MSTDSTATSSDLTSARANPPAGKHLGLALFVIAAAQLMVVLDATITNIALPSIQTHLHMSATNLAWVVNTYALAFGGLLLVGGRAGDLFGRRRVFRIGIAVFTAASLLGGLAPTAGLLLAARVLQGIGAALAAPSALSLIATTFPVGKPRNTAMGVYAAMAGMGATIGLLAGGVLTDYLNWRWVFFVNIPIGLAVLAGTSSLNEAERHPARLDAPSAISGSLGLVALVYAITRGGQNGWGDALTIGSFVAAAALLALFLFQQARTDHPLLPLRLFGDRTRSGSYATMLLIGTGMFATFYFLTLYMQLILGYSPVRTGFAYLPFSIGMALAAGISSKLVTYLPPRLIAAPGLAVAAAGMLWFATLTPTSPFTTHLMPAMFITALGLGLGFVPMTLAAVHGVGHQDAGIASALLNAAQQIGGALGLAILSTISTSAANHRLPNAVGRYFQAAATYDQSLLAHADQALTHGYTVAFTGAAIFFAVALLIAAFAINAGKQHHTGETTAIHIG